MDTTYSLKDSAAQFRHFAEFECTDDALYVAICEAIAAEPALLALMQHAAPTQRKPNLLLAALHERVLAGVAHPLRDYYASVGGQRAPDAELSSLLLQFARREQAALIQHLGTRSTQTNECGRSAVLWPALQAVASIMGRQDLALLDFGSSAGLNLAVDDYRYDYGHFQRGAAAAPDQPLVQCEWHGDASPFPEGGWRLAERAGIDPSPIALDDEDAIRWLRACLWPGDRERAKRFDQAVLTAKRRGIRVERAADCTAAIEGWLDGLPEGVQPVLFNSWVLAYFEPAELARHRALVEGLTLRRGLAWLSAESPRLHSPGLDLPPLIAGVAEATATLWTLQWGDHGQARQQALAWSHPHGRWVQWTHRR